MSSSVLFGESSIFAKIDSFTSLGMDRKLDKLLGFGPGKPTVQRIGELASQTAKEGEARPIVWGRVRPISGNVMHASEPRIVRVEVKGQSSGGKGGKKKAAKQYQERVFKTYAIRICEGPITAVIRVWRNNKLVFDARGNEWGTKNNGVFLKLAKFYLGGWDQMPDSTLESIWGAGNVPGYRGTCYMRVADEDLTDLGGAVPQYTFEVERAEGVALTSKPYPVEVFENTDAGPPGISDGAIASPNRFTVLAPEATDAAPSTIVGGDLRATLQLYSFTEATDASSPVISYGELRQTLILTQMTPEATDAASPVIQSGILKATLIKYEQYPPEATDAAAPLITGGVF